MTATWMPPQRKRLTRRWTARWPSRHSTLGVDAGWVSHVHAAQRRRCLADVPSLAGRCGLQVLGHRAKRRSELRAQQRSGGRISAIVVRRCPVMLRRVSQLSSAPWRPTPVHFLDGLLAAIPGLSPRSASREPRANSARSWNHFTSTLRSLSPRSAACPAS